MTARLYPFGGWRAHRLAAWERTGVALALVALVAAYVALGLAYATMTPAWQNPDEPAHYNYAASIARTGQLPELRAGDWDSALLERLKTGQLAPTDPQVSSIRYESWQPPLYYLLAAQLIRLAPGADLLDQLRLLRVADVLLGAVTLLVAYRLGRELFPETLWLALAMPLAMCGVPMFTSVSAAVSADPLANLLAASLALLLLGGMRRSTPPHWAVMTGVALGLGLLTKLALAVFVPLALGIGVRRGRSEAASLAVLPVLLLAPWLVHQVTTYGWLDPLATSRHAQVVVDQPRFPGLSPEYVRTFAATTFHSFWAQFGWMAIPAPDRLYWVWGALSLLGAVGLCMTGRTFAARWWLMLLVVLLSLLGYVGYNLVYLQLQGRYLFIGLAPLCALLVRGWAAWLPERVRPTGPLVLGALLVVLNVYTLTRVLEPGFRG